MLATNGAEDAGLRLMLPALLALDALRFRLPRPRDRRAFRTTIDYAYEVAFEAAERTGDKRLFAELVETARGNGVPSFGYTNSATTQLRRGGDLLLKPPSREFAGPAAGASVEDIALGPPPRLVMPWGAVALIDHLPAAELRAGHPVRAPSEVVLIT
jgi:hypothetical protein